MTWLRQGRTWVLLCARQQRFESIAGQHTVEKKSLHLIARQIAQQSRLLFGFDAFGNDLEIERMRERDDRRYDRQRLGVARKIGQERAVDLQRRHG